MKLKNAIEMPFSGEAKRALSFNREDDLLHCAGEQLRSWRRGRNSLLYYRDAQSIPVMSKNFQSEISCFSLIIPRQKS